MKKALFEKSIMSECLISSIFDCLVSKLIFEQNTTICAMKKKPFNPERSYSTQYGKWFEGDKQNLLSNQYFPQIQDIKQKFKRMQISDNNFYPGKQLSRDGRQPNKAFGISPYFGNKMNENSKPVTEIEKMNFMKSQMSIKPQNQEQNEIMATLKQSKYKERPNSSRIQKRIFLSAHGKRSQVAKFGIGDELGEGIISITGLSKGITPKKAQIANIPIKTFSRNFKEENLNSCKPTKKAVVAKGSFGLDSPNVEIVGTQIKRGSGSAVPRKRGIAYKEDELIKHSSIMRQRTVEDDHHKKIPSTAPNVSFQTSLSPDFLELFAKN